MVREEEFNDQDFEVIAEKAALKHLGRLQQYHFIFSPSYHVRTAAERNVWSLNLRRFEEYVKAYASNAYAGVDRKDLFQTGTPMFSSSIFSRRSIKPPRRPMEADRSLGEGSGREIKLDQLPGTAKEMIALLEKDGDNVMRLIARLKVEERERRKGVSSESTPVKL